MTKAPAVSVIVPCYNQGAYVDEAIQSVLGQTVQDFEILVINDGSTDEATNRILASRQWPHTTVYQTENGGLARARNYLIDRARGDYLCALDADDKLHPRYFEQTLAAFDREPSLVFVSSLLQMFGEDDRVWPPHSRCDLEALLCDDPIFSAALVRRSAVLAAGKYDQNMPSQGDEDWDLWISLLEAGHRGVILPEILFYYRRRRGSMCDLCTSGDTHLSLTAYLVRKHRASYEAHLPAVLLWKDAQLVDQRDATARLEREVADLGSVLDRSRAELIGLQRTLTDCRDKVSTQPSVITAVQDFAANASRRELEAVHAEYRRAMSEVTALRSSASWRVTAPLRASYDVLRRWLKGGSQ